MLRFVRSAGWIVVLLGSVAALAYGDSGWTWQNPTPTGNDLRAVAVIDRNTGTAVGAGGTILRTTDGGATWQQQVSGTIDYLTAVSFTGVNTGTVVGANGSILRTIDGGATWISQWPARFYHFWGVCFTDADTGTVVGDNNGSGRILRTTNGGFDWTLQYSGGRQLFSVSFVNASTGTAVGVGGTILRTTDAGATWKATARFYALWTAAPRGERDQAEPGPGSSMFSSRTTTLQSQ